jgi:hypothetical protein
VTTDIRPGSARHHQRIAHDLSPKQRRVLYSLRRHFRMTADHVHESILYHALSHGDAARLRWPLSSLFVLLDKGLATREDYSTEDRQKHETLWSITPLGAHVARYCYADGGVANG